MRRFPVAAAALALALAGCPLPQPLPDYPAGTITPPRILADEIDGNAQVVRLVPAGCATSPSYPLTAKIVDTNTIETVEARWFVNYEPTQPSYYRPAADAVIPAPADATTLVRTVPPDDAQGNPQPFLFRPYDYAPPYGTPVQAGPPYPQPGVTRVVELVVSNGFDPAATETPAASLPRRATLVGFETQVYRWTFVTVDGLPCPP